MPFSPLKRFAVTARVTTCSLTALAFRVFWSSLCRASLRCDQLLESAMEKEISDVGPLPEMEPTVEELELLWWEPLSCKCEVDFDE